MCGVCVMRLITLHCFPAAQNIIFSRLNFEPSAIDVRSVPIRAGEAVGGSARGNGLGLGWAEVAGIRQAGAEGLKLMAWSCDRRRGSLNDSRTLRLRGCEWLGLEL